VHAVFHTHIQFFQIFFLRSLLNLFLWFQFFFEYFYIRGYQIQVQWNHRFRTESKVFPTDWTPQTELNLGLLSSCAGSIPQVPAHAHQQHMGQVLYIRHILKGGLI
jgi:hypothetical protein